MKFYRDTETKPDNTLVHKIKARGPGSDDSTLCTCTDIVFADKLVDLLNLEHAKLGIMAGVIGVAERLGVKVD